MKSTPHIIVFAQMAQSTRGLGEVTMLCIGADRLHADDVDHLGGREDGIRAQIL